jgi:hypothetical protein
MQVIRFSKEKLNLKSQIARSVILLAAIAVVPGSLAILGVALAFRAMTRRINRFRHRSNSDLVP